MASTSSGQATAAGRRIVFEVDASRRWHPLIDAEVTWRYISSATMSSRRVFVTGRSPIQRASRVLETTGLARTRELEKAGVSRTQLRRLVEAGEVQRVARGLYALPGASLTQHQDIAAAARRVPRGVACLLSALRFHKLTTQNPFEVWMAVDHKAWRPAAGHPPLRLVYLTGPALGEGVEEHDVAGVTVRVFSAAKTVADCFKFRNKIGIDVAIEALRDFRRQHPKRLAEVWRFAQIDRVGRIIQPYLEAVA